MSPFVCVAIRALVCDSMSDVSLARYDVRFSLGALCELTIAYAVDHAGKLAYVGTHWRGFPFDFPPSPDMV